MIANIEYAAILGTYCLRVVGWKMRTTFGAFQIGDGGHLWSLASEASALIRELSVS
jgi:hypothetical protein